MVHVFYQVTFHVSNILHHCFRKRKQLSCEKIDDRIRKDLNHQTIRFGIDHCGLQFTNSLEKSLPSSKATNRSPSVSRNPFRLPEGGPTISSCRGQIGTKTEAGAREDVEKN